MKKVEPSSTFFGETKATKKMLTPHTTRFLFLFFFVALILLNQPGQKERLPES